MRTLVLNSSMQPIRTCSWQDAMTVLSKGSAEVLEEYSDVVGALPLELASSYREFLIAIRKSAEDARDGAIDIHAPAVIRVVNQFSTRMRKVKFSRLNVFTRDKFSCQYCGKKFSASAAFKMLTYDHVIPRHQGGRTIWTNIVTACYDCNSAKANMTPEQAGMRLLSQPRRPHSLPLQLGLHIRGPFPDEWKPYLEHFNRA